MKQESNHTLVPPSTKTEIVGEGEMCVRKVVTICPTVEELRVTSASPSACSQLMCPVPGCRAFTFKKQGSLIQHINAVHPQLNPYKGASSKEKSEDYHFHCPQADCVYNSHLRQRWFSSLDHLRYHYINTHDEKRFACSKCGKRFGWKRDQEYHERECGQTFACGSCTAKYPSRRSLLTHCLRKQHPVPPQFEKPAQKVKDANKVTPSTQPVTAPSTVSILRLAPSVTVPATSSTSGLSPLSVPSGVSSPVISSACSGASAISSPAVMPGSTGISGGDSVIVLPSSSDVPGVSIAIMSPTSFSVPGVPRAVTTCSNVSVTTDAVSAIATDISSHSSAGVLTSASDPGVTGLVPAVSLGTSEVNPSSADTTGMSHPSFNTSTEMLHVSQPLSNNLDLFAKSFSISTPPPTVCHAVTPSQLVQSPSVSTGLSLPQDSTSDNTTTLPHSETGDSISKLCITQTDTSQPGSNVEIVSTTQTPTLKYNSGVTNCTTPAKSTTPSTAVRKKLRPILPKSQGGVVVVRANPPTLYTTQNSGPGTGCVLHSPVLPWIGRSSVDAATAAKDSQEGREDGASIASVDGGGEGGQKDRVQVPVVHMATQVSRGALHPLSICHTGTQVYGPAVWRGDSIHTAVQTCVQTAHSGTQLAAPLPGQEAGSQDRRFLDSIPRPPEEEHRQVCAVAIQTGGRVDTVNMAIQATAQHSALDPLSTQGASIMLDMIQLCDSQPENDGVMGPRVSGSLSGTHMASQTSFPYIVLNKAISTNTTGTQVATGLATEELDVASRGMQTSVTLLHRPKLGMMAVQTQTCSDAVSSGAGSKSPRSHSRRCGSRVRKRSTKSSEVQTQPCSPCTKKGRRKGTDASQGMHGVDVQEISIATQTLTEETPHQAHILSNTMPMPLTTAGRPTKTDKQHKGNRSKSSKTKEVQKKSTRRSPQPQQNTPLSVSATQEDQSGVWDPFLSSPITAPSSPPAHTLSPHLEDLLSDYRVDLGVQTPQDFLSEFTADFGMQTMGGTMLSTTSDLAVQTLDVGQQPCTAELGVQTVTSALGCLLENLDADFPCSSLEEDILYPTPSSLSSFQSSDRAQQVQPPVQNSKPFSSAPQVHSMGCQSEVFDDLSLDASVPSLHTGTAPKLFDSFDSDLSFSDCGTGTEDFFASTHTQTAGIEVTMEEDCLSPALSSLYGQPGLEGPVSLASTTQTEEKGRGTDSSSHMDMFAAATDSPPNEVSGIVDEPVGMLDFCPSLGTCMSSQPTSSCTTDTDLLSGVPATDMHTQTADDLLTFLMNNMETQTTEDLGSNKMAVADTHTQTSSSVLLTPPHPMSSSDGTSSSWLGEEGVVSAETQTSAQLMWDLHQDQEELFDLTDMETQTMLW